MESFFEKLNSSHPNVVPELYPFETDVVESELSFHLLEKEPIRSSNGLQAIYIPQGCVQSFDDIDEICTLRFKSNNEQEPIDGCIVVSPLPPNDNDGIFNKETVEALIWQMTEADEEAIDYQVNEVSKVVKNKELGVFLDYSVAYENALVRNLQYTTIKNNNYIIVTVSIPEQLSEKLGPAAFTTALSLVV